MIPVIFGEVLFDCFNDGSRVLGGAPFNVAWHLRAFGQRPVMISSVGDDEAGSEVLQRMQAWSMDNRGMQVTTRYPTGLVRIELQQGQPHYEIVKPVAWDIIEAGQLPIVEDAFLLYHGTLALRSATSIHALQHLKRHSCSGLFIDVNLRDPWWRREQVMQWLTDCHWIKLNQKELNDLLPEISNDLEGIENLFKATRAECVLLTCGQGGARLFHRDGSQWSIKPEASIAMMDAVGAGDAFASIYLLGVLLGWPEQLMLQRAQDFASAVIGLRGAITNNRLFYQHFKDRWEM
ncbi:MAG: carbohydrate kinase [Nitrosomonas sp.]|nr:carbohydrate kinase [Nitrosomonas sp.]